MALSSTLIKKVTKMNRAAQDVNLGYVLDNLITSASSAAGTLTASVTTLTAHMVTSGCVAVTPTEASASVCYILTGTSSIKGFVVQPYRSGSLVSGATAIPAATGSKITVTNGPGTYKLTDADVMQWIVW
jgi:hypothetical protein